MEIQGIEEPFKWSRELVDKVNTSIIPNQGLYGRFAPKLQAGLYYSPSRKVGVTSEGERIAALPIDSLDTVREAFQGYYNYIQDFIEDMKKVFPTLGDDWGVYIPEVKYLSPEPLVDYKNLALAEWENVHFVGDALSARGITVSGAQGTYVAEDILNKFCKVKGDSYICEWDNHQGDIISFK